MVNVRIGNGTPNVRIGGNPPTVRASSFQTGHAGHTIDQIVAGMPIGLLLALTYSGSVHPDKPLSSDRPNVRIVTV